MTSGESTKAAAKSLGYPYVLPINHSREVRDRDTGFHSNDIESENNRLMHWARARYSKLSLNEGGLHEYTYYVNVGSSLEAVVKALA